jgi:hypothetical protein
MLFKVIKTFHQFELFMGFYSSDLMNDAHTLLKKFYYINNLYHLIEGEIIAYLTDLILYFNLFHNKYYNYYLTFTKLKYYKLTVYKDILYILKLARIIIESYRYNIFQEDIDIIFHRYKYNFMTDVEMKYLFKILDLFKNV